MSVIDETFGATLKTREAFADLKKQWNDLKAHNREYTPDESLKHHNVLIDALLDFWSLTSDKSGLTTDPDMDTMNLGDAAITKIPEVLKSVGRMRCWGTRYSKRKDMTPEEKTELVVLAQIVRELFSRSTSGLHKGDRGESALARVLGAKIKEMDDTVQSFIKTDAAAVINGDFSMAPDEYFKRASTATDAIYGLFDVEHGTARRPACGSHQPAGE